MLQTHSRNLNITELRHPISAVQVAERLERLGWIEDYDGGFESHPGITLFFFGKCIPLSFWGVKRHIFALKCYLWCIRKRVMMSYICSTQTTNLWPKLFCTEQCATIQQKATKWMVETFLLLVTLLICWHMDEFFRFVCNLLLCRQQIESSPLWVSRLDGSGRRRINQKVITCRCPLLSVAASVWEAPYPGKISRITDTTFVIQYVLHFFDDTSTNNCYSVPPQT